MIDPAPPIEGEAGRVVQASFVRLVRELAARRDLGWAVRTVLSCVPELSRQGLVRALELSRQLHREVLPQLRKRLRTESRSLTGWDVAPRRGGIDAVGTLRRAAISGAELPDRWQTRSTERWVSTPVNRYAARLLWSVQATLESLASSPELLTRERSVLLEAQDAVTQFFATTPLAALERERSPDVEALRREALRRPAEYRAVEPLERLHESLRATRLDEVRWEEDLLEPALCYEGFVALSFVLALAERRALAPIDGALVFRGDREAVRADFRRATLRSPTLYLERVDAPQRCLVVEARNYTSECASDHIDGALYRAGGRPVAYFTPSPPVAVEARPGLIWVQLGGRAPATNSALIDRGAPPLDGLTELADLSSTSRALLEARALINTHL